ncbi:MAG TPA: hypothetical protein VHP30_02965 [Ignavibacteriales bacterium]|nr:hypothetical protein [Ignavibacteriales bacterium]
MKLLLFRGFMSYSYIGFFLIINGLFLLYLHMFHYKPELRTEPIEKWGKTPLKLTDIAVMLMAGGLFLIYKDTQGKFRDVMWKDFLDMAKYGNLYFFFLGCVILLMGNFFLEVLTALGFNFETDASDKRFITFGLILIALGAASYFGL